MTAKKCNCVKNEKKSFPINLKFHYGDRVKIIRNGDIATLNIKAVESAFFEGEEWIVTDITVIHSQDDVEYWVTLCDVYTLDIDNPNYLPKEIWFTAECLVHAEESCEELEQNLEKEDCKCDKDNKEENNKEEDNKEDTITIDYTLLSAGKDLVNSIYAEALLEWISIPKEFKEILKFVNFYLKETKKDLENKYE